MTPSERAGHLAHALLPPFAQRVAESRAVVADWLSRCRRPYIAFSAGKDSTVSACLVWEQDSTVPAVYFDAENAFPGTTALLDRLEAAGRTIVRWPCGDFLDILAEAGGPDAPGVGAATMRATVYRPIRALLGRYGFDGACVGLRGASPSDESRDRWMLVRTRGLLFENARDGVVECLPVGRWSDRDVWAAIAAWGLDYNAEYAAMGDLPYQHRRVSYWAGETARTHGRWVWLRQHHPDLWARFVTRFPETARFT